MRKKTMSEVGAAQFGSNHHSVCSDPFGPEAASRGKNVYLPPDVYAGIGLGVSAQTLFWPDIHFFLTHSEGRQPIEHYKRLYC